MAIYIDRTMTENFRLEHTTSSAHVTWDLREYRHNRHYEL